MFFTFRLKRIQCNRVLSGEDSIWGQADGIRLFFFVFDSRGFRQLFISGREYPEPDAVDNYSFNPGESMDLSFFPPFNAPDWETDPVDVGETDIVSMAIVGLNEGLPYVAGGGGFGAGDEATISGMEELSKKMSDEAVDEAKKRAEELGVGAAGAAAGGAGGAVALTVAFKLLESFIEELNRASDCRGVAFAFEVGLGLSRLFEMHMRTKRSTITLNAVNAANALHLVALSRLSAGCGRPDYEVELEITRSQNFALDIDDRSGAPRPGEPRRFQPPSTLCTSADSEIRVWPIFFDRDITIQPSIPKYSSLRPTWSIDGQTLPEGLGPLALTKQVAIPVDRTREQREVQLACEVATLAGKQLLRIKTQGIDGNYMISVGLSFQFADNSPHVLFKQIDLLVSGQSMSGDKAYETYLACLETHRKIVGKYVRANRFIGPGTPVEDVIQFEHDMLGIAQDLRQVPAVSAIQVNPLTRAHRH